MTTVLPLVYPRQFRGMFTRVRESYTPLIEQARRALNEASMPTEIRPFYDYVVRDNPQPSFMLLPLMFLAIADSSGGMTARHRKFLPALILALEACAVADDTVDRTPMRSGRKTFPLRFGESSSTPFAGALIAMVAAEGRRIDPRAFEWTMRFFVELFSYELWERHNVYPVDTSAAVLEQWLDRRYRQTGSGVAYVLNTALLLSERAPIDNEVSLAFARLFQDVDDIVNVCEQRALEGENDDIKMGAVTRPLVHALERVPTLRRQLDQLWATCRGSAGATVGSLHECGTLSCAEVDAAYHPVHQAVLEIGVPATVSDVLGDFRACVAGSPPALLTVMAEMAGSWVDRLRRAGDRELVSELQLARALDGIEITDAA